MVITALRCLSGMDESKLPLCLWRGFLSYYQSRTIVAFARATWESNTCNCQINHLLKLQLVNSSQFNNILTNELFLTTNHKKQKRKKKHKLSSLRWWTVRASPTHPPSLYFFLQIFFSNSLIHDSDV